MSMREWAKQEVEIMKKKMQGEKDAPYIICCCESALRAYESLIEDRHSGASFAITRDILNHLLNEIPLSPIEDADDIWGEFEWETPGEKAYQCKRRSALFKLVHDDGTILYSDIDRVRGRRPGTHAWFSNGFLTKFVDKLIPIEMPYTPRSRPYIMTVEECLFDKKNGDFDTLHYVELETGEGTTIPIHRYFKDDGESDDLIEIYESEYNYRKEHRVDREQKEDRNEQR